MTTNNSPGLRVLVVDDEPLIRWSLTETLGRYGHTVAEAGDGASAVDAISDGKARFDVVILDYRLPDSNDLHLLETVRGLAPQAALIMMTAYGSPEVTGGALKLGAYSVVPKPFDMDEMARLVLEARRATRGT